MEYTFEVGEEVEVTINYLGFKNKRVVIVKRYKDNNGEELYRVDPVNDNHLQKNVRFTEYDLRKVGKNVRKQIPYRPAPISVTVFEEPL